MYTCGVVITFLCDIHFFISKDAPDRSRTACYDVEVDIVSSRMTKGSATKKIFLRIQNLYEISRILKSPFINTLSLTAKLNETYDIVRFQDF